MIQCDCRVLSNKIIGPDMFLMVLDAPQIVNESKPGQFVQLRVSPGIDPLLRRPFCVFRVDPQKGHLFILYRVIGRGTALMKAFKTDDVINVLGPLGAGFDIQHCHEHVLVVAGGMGCAPVFFLMDQLVAQKKQITFFWGAKTGDEIFAEEELTSLGIKLHLATEDGSKGAKGFITHLLNDFLNRPDLSSIGPGFVCGPHPMLHAVQTIASNFNIPWQVSMEERMACGIGVCQGCAVETRNQGIQMVCKNGPVFDLEEIIFHD